MTPPITIPRQPNESNRAYAARVKYVTAGPQRSIDKLRDRLGKPPGYERHLQTWSSTYGWVESARQYDDTVAALATQQASQQYLADLEEHRQRYQKTGRDLHRVASALLAQCGAAIAGKRITGTDGKEYLIPAMKLDATALGQAVKALQVAADLEAHALRVGELVPRLSDDLHDS